MSREPNPLTRRYLEQLGAALDAALVAADERAAILAEIESHLAEAARSGVALPDALEGLGPAQDLARAYAVELVLNPRPGAADSRPRRILAALRRASAALAALLLIVVMGGIGFGLTLGGAVTVLAGLIAPFLPAEWLDPTLRAGLPQLVVALAGVALLSVGIVSMRIVHLNARFLLGALRHDPKGDSR